MGAMGESVALRFGQHGREVPHHLGVAIERCERLKIDLPPLTKQQPAGGELGHQRNLTERHTNPLERQVAASSPQAAMSSWLPLR